MISTLELLAAAKSRVTPSTDYQVAKQFGLTRQTVSRWYKGVSMSPEVGFMFADFLGLDDDFVYLSLMAEKAHSEREKAVLNRLCA